jgi:hypothetical protein
MATKRVPFCIQTDIIELLNEEKVALQKQIQELTKKKRLGRFLMRQKNWQQTWIENHPLSWKIICAIGDMLIFFMKFMISMLIFLWLVN